MDKPLERPFNWRGFVSVTTGLAFIGLAGTGIVLFFIPPGRIANWSGWHFLRLTKQQWNGLHIWFGLLFFIVALFHMAYNWKCLISYFKDKARRHFALRWEWGAALLLVWVMSAGTVTGMIPFSSFLHWHTAIKHRQNNQASWPSNADTTTGFASNTDSPNATGNHNSNRGRGFGQMTLSAYCEQKGLDLSKACAILEQAGMTVNPKMTLREIANTGQAHPSEIRGLLEDP
ncbi:DUF4405 domain-containing protein [Planctomycetota bacterium]